MVNSSSNNKQSIIDIEVLKQLLAASDEYDFRNIRKHNFGDSFKNIDKISVKEINKRFNIKLPFENDVKFNVINNTQIDYDIEFDDATNINTPLFIYKSKLKALRISSKNQKKLCHIYILDTDINDVEFKKCFLKSFTIEGNDKPSNISFIACTIKKVNLFNCQCRELNFKEFSGDNIKIHNKCSFSDIKFQKESKVNDLDIRNSVIKYNLFVQNSSIANLIIDKSKVNGSWENINAHYEYINTGENSNFIEVKFRQNCRIKEVLISESNLENLKILENSEIKKINIKNSFLSKSITISRNVLINELKIDFSCLNEFVFYDSTIREVILTNIFSNTLVASSTKIDYFIIDELSKVGDLVFEKSQLDFFNASKQYSSFTITGSSLKLMHLDNCNIHKFDISMGSEVEAYIESGNINLISFTKTSIGQNSLISFVNTSIFCLQMEVFSVLGNLHFSKIKKAKNLFQWWWSESYELEEKNIRADFYDIYKEIKDVYQIRCNELNNQFNIPTIRLAHASLEKTSFTNCPLADFRFEFNNSKITECFISGGSVPDKNIIIIDDYGKALKKEEQESHGQKASIYNQFKKIFDAQGDAYRSAQFQAKWAEHQKKYLTLIYKDKKGVLKLFGKVKHFFSELSQDIGIFRLNKWSNNHGESWIRALGFTIIGSILIYIIYLSLIGRCFNSNSFDFNLIGYYFEFLIPVHKIDFIYGERPVWYAIPVDFLGRMFVAYGIYQFIAAFRKHGRKK